MATMTMERMGRIVQHGKNLLAIFPRATEQFPDALCRKLRRLEAKAAALALRGCNGPEWDSEEEQEAAYESVLEKVNALLGNHTTHNSETGDTRCRVPVFINRDPRGYQLKIRDEYVRQRGLKIETDWGGYGILAPEIK